MMNTEPTLSFNQTVKGITEFIEVAIHTILYVRQVYPAEIFVRRKKYDTPVFQSRHPALNEYISGAVKAISEELGNVDKAIVVIKNKEDVALERFIFGVQNMLHVEAYDKDSSVENAMTSMRLGQYFRSFLTRLTMMEAQLGLMPRPDEITFAIVLELKDDQAPSAHHGEDPPPWIPATSRDTTSGASEKAELHMVRAVDTGVISLSLTVQESEEKLRLLDSVDVKGKGSSR